MKDFMTKISDYLNERRNDPERRENQLSIVIIGAVAVVVIILLLLLFWTYTVKEQERKQKEAAKEALLEAEMQMKVPVEEEELVAETHEEKAEEYMSQNDGREQELKELALLREEYSGSIDFLREKVEELLKSMTQVENNLSETIVKYQEGDQSILEQVKELHGEVTNIVQNLKETQTKLYDLTDIVQVLDQKTIPQIQQQILDIQQNMNKVHADISNLYTKIAALEQEDAKLWAGISEVEKTLKTAIDQNMTEVNNQLDVLLNQLGNVENRLQGLISKTLKYHYDAENNTLYLEPYSEQKANKTTTKGRKRKYEKKDDPKEKKEQTALPVQNGARKENTEDFHHEIQEQQAYRKPAENKICEVYQKGSHVVRRRDGGGASFPRHTGTGGRRDRAIPQPGRDPLYECGRAGNHSRCTGSSSAFSICR